MYLFLLASSYVIYQCLLIWNEFLAKIWLFLLQLSIIFGLIVNFIKGDLGNLFIVVFSELLFLILLYDYKKDKRRKVYETIRNSYFSPIAISGLREIKDYEFNEIQNELKKLFPKACKQIGYFLASYNKHKLKITVVVYNKSAEILSYIEQYGKAYDSVVEKNRGFSLEKQIEIPVSENENKRKNVLPVLFVALVFFFVILDRSNNYFYEKIMGALNTYFAFSWYFERTESKNRKFGIGISLVVVIGAIYFIKCR